MNRIQRRFVTRFSSALLVAALVFLAGVLSSTRASGVDEKPLSLQAILDRIHGHAASSEWREPGWKDKQIEGWLTALTVKISRAAEAKELKLPIVQSETKSRG